eukprot:364247-Chlamydomonas_euryale.AAC.26
MTPVPGGSGVFVWWVFLPPGKPARSGTIPRSRRLGCPRSIRRAPFPSGAACERRCPGALSLGA